MPGEGSVGALIIAFIVHDLPQSSGEPNDNLVKLVSFDFTGRI
jgi:hypothetical protein